MKIYICISVVLSAMLTIVACKKDNGVDNYHPINEISFTNLDTIQGYKVNNGDVLDIKPTLTYSMDAESNGTYTYQWTLTMQIIPYGGTKDSVISISKNLSASILLKPGTYQLKYKVTDEGTGVTFQKRMKLNVTTPVYEGYLLLNEVNEDSRLDMLSFDLTANTFTQQIDILKKLQSTVPMNGKPYQVYCSFYSVPNVIPENYGIFILNSAGSNRIHQETFAWEPVMSIRNLFVGDVPANFKATRMFKEWMFNGINNPYGFPLMHLFDDAGNVYNYANSGGPNGYIFHYSPLNAYTAAGRPFKVAPFGVTNGNISVFYNTEKRNYVVAPTYSALVLADAAANLNYPAGLDMIYMEKDYNNIAFSILKDPRTSKIYLHKFTIGSPSSYFEEMIGVDIEKASHFALSPLFGYVFYSVGGKVYEYDPSLKTSKLMIDKGADAITYLNFQHFFDRVSPSVNKANYAIWSNYLNVASYGTSATSGAFELYEVLPLNQQISLKNRWTGFGKIVSVSYRERY